MCTLPWQTFENRWQRTGNYTAVKLLRSTRDLLNAKFITRIFFIQTHCRYSLPWPINSGISRQKQLLQPTHLLNTSISWYWDCWWNRTLSTCRDIACPGHISSLISLNHPLWILPRPFIPFIWPSEFLSSSALQVSVLCFVTLLFISPLNSIFVSRHMGTIRCEGHSRNIHQAVWYCRVCKTLTPRKVRKSVTTNYFSSAARKKILD